MVEAAPLFLEEEEVELDEPEVEAAPEAEPEPDPEAAAEPEAAASVVAAEAAAISPLRDPKPDTPAEER